MCFRDHKLSRKSSNNLKFYWVLIAFFFFFVEEIQFWSSLQLQFQYGNEVNHTIPYLCNNTTRRNRFSRIKTSHLTFGNLRFGPFNKLLKQYEKSNSDIILKVNDQKLQKYIIHNNKVMWFYYYVLSLTPHCYVLKFKPKWRVRCCDKERIGQQQEGKHKVEEGHWYTHIMRKVNAKEWERTLILWCKGHGRVKLGPTRPPDPEPLWCCSLQDRSFWGSSVQHGLGTAPLPWSQRDPGTRLCPQRKCTWLWVGQVERSQAGIMGRSKQTDWGKHMRWLSQTKQGEMMYELYIVLRRAWLIIYHHNGTVRHYYIGHSLWI